MKILVCCGSGLGSSFMIEMNIKNVLKELGVEAEVTHCDLSSAAGNKSDIYVGTRDIATQLVGLGGEVVSLNNMIDKQELKEKITAAVEKVSQG
ncbi:PTS sugar transporter subunit IIB [Selenomonas caprae]|jgi:PTS system ascorbate-specific IIB component|uniref:PTS system IIB component, L-Asc family n=2 Tax=Selenomonas TaxID=970 RepID=A0A1I3FJ15_SELRU|nr:MULTISPECIES: PTS sugar transporter subunit IIB [Selenomonas]MBQ1416304.1 PTS sugar transporter subunit IIB [Selenomonas sp.]MBE6074639.1 PTS sugar transporter subunit IIB [Selenomonas ruminantium]MBQ1889449.1 PTS sugar transporter subunit IIB [Selenomonas sp.]TYZ27187.1 PTS sugar transporter subunit IIB [Selenomonas caprae]SFI11213.1 PTS system IIB component, L-Asc family [Selenomonas ruminantium]